MGIYMYLPEKVIFNDGDLSTQKGDIQRGLQPR